MGRRQQILEAASQYRPQLLRFARLQIQDAGAAEDVVQDVMLAVGEKGEQFQGRSELRTWLFSILRHKVIDYIRTKKRDPLMQRKDRFEDGEVEADNFDRLFKEDGHWKESPADWGDPYAAIENSQFLDIFEDCLSRLPKRTARVFTMREILDLKVEEICKEMDITPTNSWVMLYRARMRLRECLQKNWFDGT